MSPSSTLLSLGLAAAAALGLAATNPGPDEFENFAAGQLTHLITEELCHENGLPLMFRLVIRDCPALIASQQQVLGQLALQHSRRHNLVLLSFYQTQLGGEQIMPNLTLPRYEALTMAFAGRFVLLRTGQSNVPAGSLRQ